VRRCNESDLKIQYENQTVYKLLKYGKLLTSACICKTNIHVQRGTVLSIG